MADLWLRSATVQIGTRRYSMDTMDFSFEVPFEDSEELTAATVKIKNLSQQTRNAIQKNDVVIINAGYEGDVGAIFVGQVAGYSNKVEGVDLVTTITATAALEEWLKKPINKTYNKGIQASAILADLLNLFGIEVGQMQLVKDITYPRGKVCKGMLRDVLTEIITSDCKSRFLIKQGQLFISNPNQGENKGYVLSGSTGLLRSSDEQVIIPVETPQKTQESAEKKEEDENLIKRSCFLNYHLGPGELVMIRSKALIGAGLIVRGKHIGSRTSDWKTEIEVKPQ
ncbi:MAG: hypothetical protein LBJ11_09135 [Oscillospiraceae bacterium]|jgi:hypothetical protein|nr:hypothetical protein [Oscillospiraceae bacterium]